MFLPQNNHIINIEVIINENIGIIDEKKLTKITFFGGKNEKM